MNFYKKTILFGLIACLLCVILMAQSPRPSPRPEADTPKYGWQEEPNEKRLMPKPIVVTNNNNPPDILLSDQGLDVNTILQQLSTVLSAGGGSGGTKSDIYHILALGLLSALMWLIKKSFDTEKVNVSHIESTVAEMKNAFGNLAGLFSDLKDLLKEHIQLSKQEQSKHQEEIRELKDEIRRQK